MIIIKFILFILFVVIINNKNFSQKNLTINDCESLFQKNNLLILAKQYNIDVAKANIIQAKIWENPVFTASVNMYNSNGNDKKLFNDSRFFNLGNDGEKFFGIQQLIYLGGKKKKEASIAKGNLLIAELEYESLIKNLINKIRYYFYSLHFNLAKKEIVFSQLQNINTLINSFKEQATKGNISLMEVVRLEALALNLNNDYVEIQKTLTEEIENLKLLTGANDDFIPTIKINEFNNYYSFLALKEESLFNICKENNLDYLITLKSLESKKLNLEFQKSIKIPNLTVGINYDQRAGAFPNEFNLNIGMPLPIWNSNKGNIKAANFMVLQSKLETELQTNVLKKQVSLIFKNWELQYNLYKNKVANINEVEFNQVYEGVLNNFRKKNITILEFTDFVESYKQSMFNIYEIKKQLIIACEEINLVTNLRLF